MSSSSESLSTRALKTSLSLLSGSPTTTTTTTSEDGGCKTNASEAGKKKKCRGGDEEKFAALLLAAKHVNFDDASEAICKKELILAAAPFVARLCASRREEYFSVGAAACARFCSVAFEALNFHGAEAMLRAGAVASLATSDAGDAARIDCLKALIGAFRVAADEDADADTRKYMDEFKEPSLHAWLCNGMACEDDADARKGSAMLLQSLTAAIPSFSLHASNVEKLCACVTSGSDVALESLRCLSRAVPALDIASKTASPVTAAMRAVIRKVLLAGTECPRAMTLEMLGLVLALGPCIVESEKGKGIIDRVFVTLLFKTIHTETVVLLTDARYASFPDPEFNGKGGASSSSKSKQLLRTAEMWTPTVLACFSASLTNLLDAWGFTLLSSDALMSVRQAIMGIVETAVDYLEIASEHKSSSSPIVADSCLDALHAWLAEETDGKLPLRIRALDCARSWLH